MKKSLSSQAVKVDNGKIVGVNLNRLALGQEVTFTTVRKSNYSLFKTNAARFDREKRRVSAILVETDSRDFKNITPVGEYTVDLSLEIGKKFSIHLSSSNQQINTSVVESIQVVNPESDIEPEEQE